MGEVGLIAIPKSIRKNIIDGLDLDNVYYAGRLNDVEFLERLYNLEELPSYDARFSNANGDIWQHCVNNYDWEGNWVFSDQRFNLLNCPDDEFLKFLCETVHPVVRPDKKAALSLVGHYNEQLTKCGWQLEEADSIAGRAIFKASIASEFKSSIDRAVTTAQILSSNWMQNEIRRIQDSVETDPSLAIGTAKDLIESCCKTILTDLGVPLGKSDDMPTLTKKLCKSLGLVPEGIPNEARGADAIKVTLSNLAAITKNIAELRGLYGSGHGRDGSHVGLEPRHARLVASSAIAFVDFATETYLKRKLDKKS